MTATPTVERIRGRRLQRIRAQYFASHPLCVMCEAEGRTTLATQLDHIVALTNGGKDFDQDDGENRQGLCDECHEIKTNIDLGYTPKAATGVDGWPVEVTRATSNAARWRRAERGGK
jgi:5-methylcytosine-specific restriction protein A